MRGSFYIYPLIALSSLPSCNELLSASAALRPIFNTGNLTVGLKKKERKKKKPLSLTRGENRHEEGREAPALCGSNNKTLTSVNKSCTGRKQ